MKYKLNTARSRLNSESLEHSARTAVTATGSLMVAPTFKLPGAYCAPISALVVTQSTLGAAWAISRRHLVGTSLEAVLGGFLALHFGSSALMFGASLLVTGLVLAILHLDWAAYGFASITLAMLVGRPNALWSIAMGLFLEVSVGIADALFSSCRQPLQD